MEKKPRKKPAPRPMFRTCDVCSEKVLISAKDDLSNLAQHIEEHHPEYFMSNQGRAMKKRYFNPINNQWYGSLPFLTRSIHALGWTREQYYVQYGKEYLPDIWAENEHDEKYGNARNVPFCLESGVPVEFDKWKWFYPVFKSESESTTWHAKNTDRVKRAHNTIASKRKEDPNFCLNPTSIKYWINKGYSLEDAKALVRERQTTVSLEKFIQRANGDVAEGTRKWKERTEKWINTRKERNHFSGKSMISQLLFKCVSYHVSDIQYGDNEISLNLGGKRVRPDCYREVNGRKKVIEFYGDYYHANPAIYQATSEMIGDRNGGRILAEEIWKKDNERVATLTAHGYDVFVVWEKEFRANQEEIIAACVDFLTKN